MTTENYFDGEWRPVTDHSFKALEKLRTSQQPEAVSR